MRHLKGFWHSLANLKKNNWLSKIDAPLLENKQVINVIFGHFSP